MQSSYDDTVENGAREGKKRYSRPKKREEKENIFDIWSTFSSFQGKKSKTHPNLDRDRDVSLFSLLLLLFCLGFVCGGKKERILKRRERPKENLFLSHRTTSSSSHNRGTPLGATNSISSIR